MTSQDDHQDGPATAAREGTPAAPRVGVVIPAGGTAARLGGTDKTGLDVGGRPILARLVADLDPLPVVIVGPAPPGPSGPRDRVRWCREDPAGGGPAAALAAGLRLLPDADLVVAVAGDQPFAASAVPRLIEALVADTTADAAVGIDETGRDQPLLAAYRAGVLRARLAGPVDGLSMRRVTAGLTVVRVPLSAPESIDVDGPADLATARRLAPAD
ncbi:MAG: molybdenum cofactor guanylyltransferase [Cellulomonas sp.]